MAGSLIRPLVLLLFRLPFLQARNRLRSITLDAVFKNLILLSFTGGVGWAEYVFFNRFCQALSGIPFGISLFFPRILSLIGSFLFAFLAYSGALTTISAVYRSDELTLLLVCPVHRISILFYKWVEVAARSGATLLLLSIPLMLSLQRSFHLDFYFSLAYLIVVSALAALGVCLGMAAGMALMAVFPEKRLYQTLAVMGLCLAVLLIAGLRFLHLEMLWSEEALSGPLMLFLQQKPAGLSRYSPGALLSAAITPFLLHDSDGWKWVAVGTALAGLGIACVLALGNQIFYRGWRKSRETADAATRKTADFPPARHFPLPLPGAFQALMRKDWILLRRDTAVWSQLFMMIPLAALYLLNLTFIPLDTPELKSFFALFNVGAIGLIAASVGARYLFPAASREGKSVWIPLSAPVPAGQMILQKLIFHSPPVFLFSAFLLLVSSMILRLSGDLWRWCLVYGMLSSGCLCGLAVFLGFCFPVYDYCHLLEVSLGKGSFLYMAAAVLQVGSLVYLGVRQVYSHPEAKLSLMDSSLIAWSAVWGIVTVGCLWAGMQKYRKLQR